jgi:uncharacterized damage-inducible protein DinB
MLERLLGHDEWTTDQILLRCLELSDAELRQQVDAGHESVHATVVHMTGNVRVWTDLMAETFVPEVSRRDLETLSIADLRDFHREAYRDFAALAIRVQREGRLDELWLDILDNPPRLKSYGGAIGHVITHNMHHRSELLHILSRLGLKELPEGDLLGWEQTRSS